MDKLPYDKNQIYMQRLNHLLRGYFIPLIGVVIIILVIVFIYIPNVTGIVTNIGTLHDYNDKYDLLKNRISYFKNLSSTDHQLTLTDNILAVNAVLPDQAKSADSINFVNNLASQDGLQVVSANAELFDRQQFENDISLNSNLKITQITFHMTGSSDNAKKLFNDITSSKQVASVTDTTIQGNFGSGTDTQVIFTCEFYALDTNDITSNINLLSPINTSYKLDYLNSL